MVGLTKGYAVTERSNLRLSDYFSSIIYGLNNLLSQFVKL
jgi:hypothetical protein